MPRRSSRRRTRAPKVPRRSDPLPWHPGCPTLATVVDRVEIEGVDKTYASGIQALRDVSFRVTPGEFVSLLGASGCGKSTLLLMVAGLLPSSRGSIRVDGTAVTGPRPDVGVVFQSPVLLPWRTVLD